MAPPYLLEDGCTPPLIPQPAFRIYVSIKRFVIYLAQPHNLPPDKSSGFGGGGGGEGGLLNQEIERKQKSIQNMSINNQCIKLLI